MTMTNNALINLKDTMGKLEELTRDFEGDCLRLQHESLKRTGTLGNSFDEAMEKLWNETYKPIYDRIVGDI